MEGKECNIREESSTRFNPDVLLISVTNVEALLRVKFNLQHDIDTFSKSVGEGKYVDIFSKMSSDEIDALVDAIETIAKKFPVGDDNSTSNVTKQVVEPNHDDPIVHDVNINTKSTSYAGVAGANHKVSTRFEHTLYGYFIGKRNAFSVVEYYARNNWAKHGLTRIMMNAKGFFFFKFNSQAGLKVVLEGGPWLIQKAPIIPKEWSMDTRLLKEELTCILVWVKLHDVPIQVFEEDGISLIASFIRKPVMLDSYTSSMCNDSWGRGSFVRCLIEVNSEADLVDVVTIRIPSLTGDDFIKETIRVEYEWRPPRCDNNDGFQKVDNKKNKKKKGQFKSTKGSQLVGPSVKQNLRYEPKAATSEPNKGATNVGNTSKSSSIVKSTGNSSKKGHNIPRAIGYNIPFKTEAAVKVKVRNQKGWKRVCCRQGQGERLKGRVNYKGIRMSSCHVD
ncbi:zinc knuckle CX2CX4HX4C containing protein [Tanacetum coccineum]